MGWGSWVTDYNVSGIDSTWSERFQMNIHALMAQNFDHMSDKLLHRTPLPESGELYRIFYPQLIWTATQLSLFTFFNNKSTENVLNANLSDWMSISEHNIDKPVTCSQHFRSRCIDADYPSAAISVFNLFPRHFHCRKLVQPRPIPLQQRTLYTKAMAMRSGEGLQWWIGRRHE